MVYIHLTVVCNNICVGRTCGAISYYLSVGYKNKNPRIAGVKPDASRSHGLDYRGAGW